MSIIPKPTPQQTNDLRDQKNRSSSSRLLAASLTQTNPSVITNNLPPNLQPTGAAKLAIILNKKNSSIKELILPKIVELANKAGIENIGTPQMKLPDSCLNSAELNKLIATKNQITSKLNDIVKIINGFSKVLTGYNNIVKIIKKVLKVLTTTRNAVSLGVKFIPSPPGAPGIVVSSLSDIQVAKDLLSPKLSTASSAISSIQLSVSSINDTLLKTIKLLNILDQYIQKCSPGASSISLDDSLLELEQLNDQTQDGGVGGVGSDTSNSNNSLYNGFILEIVEVPFSPTVTRKKAVAKNKDGIILLQTPLSFTTTPQVLIEELKLIIDSNDLKAD